MRDNGFISLPIVIGLSVLVLSVGLLASISSYNDVISSAQFDNSSKAFSYAESGVRDILKKIVVDKTYNPSSNPYNIDFSSDSTGCVSPFNGCATIRVETGATIPTPRIITVIGRYKDAVRKVQYDAVIDTYGDLVSVSHVEIKNLPTASTAGVTNLTSTTVTLNGWTNPNSITGVTAWFRRTAANPPTPAACADTDAFGTKTPGTPISISSSANPASFSTDVSSLVSGKNYFYCTIVSDGTNKIYGNVFSFKTP